MSKKNKPRLRHLHFNPECKFEVAKAIFKAMEKLYCDRDKKRVIRWAMEEAGLDQVTAYRQ